MTCADGSAGESRRERRRRRPVKSRTIAVRRITKDERMLWDATYPEDEWRRLRATMGPCHAEYRTNGWCPLVGCRYHMYLDVNPVNGNIKLNFPDLEPWEIPETCALEAADRGSLLDPCPRWGSNHGGLTLDEVGGLMNLTRERARQMELSALDAFRGVVRPEIEEDLRLIIDAMEAIEGSKPERYGDDEVTIGFSREKVRESYHAITGRLARFQNKGYRVWEGARIDDAEEDYDEDDEALIEKIELEAKDAREERRVR